MLAPRLQRSAPPGYALFDRFDELLLCRFVERPVQRANFFHGRHAPDGSERAARLPLPVGQNPTAPIVGPFPVGRHIGQRHADIQPGPIAHVKHQLDA